MPDRSNHELVKSFGTAEVTGQNGTLQAAIETAITTAAKDHADLRWFQVMEIRGRIAGNAPEAYQVTLKVGYELKLPEK